MKRLLGILIAIVLVGMMATPAMAQGPSYTGDHACFGGSTVVTPNETPRNVILFGCGARIQSGARVLQDVVSFGGNVVVEGGATVEHDVVAFGGNVTVEPEAVVQHDVVAFGGNPDIRQGAVIQGRVLSNSTAGWQGFHFGPYFTGTTALGVASNAVAEFFRTLITALALAALGMLTVIFLPKQTKQVGDTVQASALPSLGIGCLTMIVWLFLFLLLILVSVILMVTIIGIPLAILLLVVPPVALAVAWLFGWVSVGRLVGEKILEALKTQEVLPVVAVIIGTLLLALLGAVPIIGGLVSLFVGSLAIGAVVLTRFGTQSYPPPTPVGAPLVPVAPPPPPAAPPVPPAEPAQTI